MLDSDDARSVRNLIGYLPEEKGLYKRMKVLDYIVYFGRLNGMKKADATKRAQSLLNQFQLTQWQKDRCQTLSKGMGQKVQLIATLVHDPALMILDEPFSGLDPVNVEVVRKIIQDKIQANSSVILSTHIMEQAETLCDELVLINKGKAVLEGTIDEVRTGDTISIEHTKDKEAFDGLEGIVSIKQLGRTANLQVVPEYDVQTLIAQILNRTEVLKFNASSTSLHDVFIREVGQQDTDAITA